MSKSPTPDLNTKGKNDPRWWFQPTHRFAPYLYVGIVFAVVAAYYLITIAIVTWGANEGSTLNPGTFGDTFGAINALFTGVAFAGFLISLALQRQEMAYQKEQLELQREDLQNQTKQLEHQTAELEAQKEEMKRTREEMELQRNESNLFSLLDAHKRLIDSLTYSPQALNEEDRILGDAFFRRMDGDVPTIYKRTGTNLLNYAVSETERIAEKRRKALETKRAEHFSYFLGGANEAARIFLVASGIDESDRLIKDFIREKFGSKSALYDRIYWNSLSQNERLLRGLADSELDSPNLPSLRLSFQGIRLGWQGHPVNDGFIVIDAHKDTTLLHNLSINTFPPIDNASSPFNGWNPVQFQGDNQAQILAYSPSLVNRILSDRSGLVALRESFSQQWGLTIHAKKFDLDYHLQVWLTITFSRKQEEGFCLQLGEVAG
jgi:hypothetical protein